MRVYVGAPFASAGRVRETHRLLESIGCHPTSHWAELATDAEHLSDDKRRSQGAQWQVNAECLAQSEAMLVLSEDVAGGELYAEVGRALSRGIPVLWTGPRRILSCYAPGVVIERSLDSALNRLARVAKVPTSARREALLAGFDRVTCPRCGHYAAQSAEFSDGSPAWQCYGCGALFPRHPPAPPVVAPS
jgi:hypothetical protein